MKTKASHALRARRSTAVVPSLLEKPAAGMQQVYPELRRIAAHLFKREQPGHTLQPTALVNEAFIRLGGLDPATYDSKAEFFAVVTLTMRRIMVDHARKRNAAKRGGGWHRVVLEEAEDRAASQFDVLAVDAALKRLIDFDQKLSEIAEMRVFAGLSTREIAIVTQRGESTVRRDWGIAKAWLQHELSLNLAE